MFLRPLNHEQKVIFLNLAKLAASANNVITDEERLLLEAYADEMGIKTDDAADMSLEESCRRLKEISTTREINQIVFEIVGMIMADNEYDSEEKIFIDQIAGAFELSDEKIAKMFECVNEYSALIRKINVLIYDIV